MKPNKHEPARDRLFKRSTAPTTPIRELYRSFLIRIFSSNQRSNESNVKQQPKSHLIQPGLKQKSNERVKLKVCLTLKYA